VAAKVALYQGMRESGLTGAELGYRLGVGEAAVWRLLDLDHQSPVRQLEVALKLLGRRLVVTVEAA
jgi:antitoxin HicB